MERLQSLDPCDSAWQEFVSRYAVLLKNWCRTWKVGPSDIDDLVQETLTSVVSSLPSFEHRGTGSFRGWMKTIARRCFAQLVKHSQRNPATGASTADQLSDLACEGLVDSFEQEAHRELLSISMATVKSRVHEKTWQAFEMTVLKEMPGVEVAKALNIQVGAVYMARSRVQRMITEVLEQIDQGKPS